MGVGEGVGCAPCVHTLSTGKEVLKAVKTWVPNFLLLAALGFLCDYFNMGVFPDIYTTGHLSFQSERAKFHCDINLLASRLH